MHLRLLPRDRSLEAELLDWRRKPSASCYTRAVTRPDIYALDERICFLVSLTVSTLHVPVSESGCYGGQGWRVVFQGSLGSLVPGQFLLHHAGNISQPTLRLGERWCPSFLPTSHQSTPACPAPLKGCRVGLWSSVARARENPDTGCW